MKRYNITAGNILSNKSCIAIVATEDLKGEWVKYDDVVAALGEHKYLIGVHSQWPPKEKKPKPTFREYVISKHGKFPPTVMSDTMEYSINRLSEAFAEWVEMWAQP